LHEAIDILEIIMFTKLATERVGRTLVAIAILFAGAAAVSTPAQALHSICVKQHKACISGCNKKWTSLEFRRSCYSRCDQDKRSCGFTTSGAPPLNAQVPPDPRPRPNTTTPPTGGTKADPKTVPPKTGDTRPPTGGGVFQPVPSSNSGGPILLKSSGGSGPSFRSGGGRR
jgi:hypothetical protein